MVNAVWDYPSMVRRILEIRDISTLCDICEKINGIPVLDNNSHTFQSADANRMTCKYRNKSLRPQAPCS